MKTGSNISVKNYGGLCMNIKKIISGTLAAAMTVSVFTNIPVYAETGTTTYNYDGYKVDYSITNEWFGNQSVNVTLTNTSSEPILNWALGYDANGEISGIWNGYVYRKSNEDYIIKNSGYNYEIEPYQSVSFGYTLSGDAFDAPEKFELCSKRVEKESGCDVKLNVTGDWSDGFQGEIVITNTSDAPIEAWKVDFDSNFEINNLWNGKIIESNGDSYSVASCMWTNPIAVDSSTTIGFTASKDASEPPAVSNAKLSEVVIDKNITTPDKPIEEILAVTAEAQYIEDNGTAVISWDTNVDNGTFEILYSKDNIEYTQAASVSGERSYTYSLGDTYGTVYFKIRQTTEGGQIAETSAVSVDIPVPVVPEKPTVTVSADYDAETGYVNVLWETTVEGGSFDIYVSVDNGEFTKLNSVSEAVSYSFAPEASGSYDIKVIQTTAAGITSESSIVNVVCTIPEPGEDIDWEDLTDSDEDGITDVIEINVYLTDPQNPDTDNDGLPDGYEVFTLDTDPLSADTDENGILDIDEDIDGDGLSNLREFELGTNPRDPDSDSDGLTDYDEVNIYSTDPLKYDTDDDGVSDGDEIALGLDPVNTSTDGTPDNEKTFKQTIPADDWLFYNINTDDSPVDVSLELDVAGVAINNIEASFSGYSYSMMKNEAIVGVIPEFSYNDDLKIKDVKINFDIDSSIVDDYNSIYMNVSEEFEGIKRFNVFRYFEDTNMLLPIETFHEPENNRVYAHYDDMGTYCLIDMTKWLDSLGYVPAVQNQVMTLAETGDVSKSTGAIDIVFLMYVQPAQASFIKEELTKVINTVYSNSDNVHMYFMINDGLDVIPYMTNDRNYAETKAEALSITNRLNFPLSNSVYLYKGFKAVDELDLRDEAQKHLFLIDGVFEPIKGGNNTYLNNILEKDVNFGVVCDVVNSNLNYYKSISEGNVKNNHSLFSSFITDQITFTIDTEKDYIIAANGLTAIPDDFGPITTDSTRDYDNDGLLDVTEINFEAKDINGNSLITFNSENIAVLPSFNNCVEVGGTYVEDGLKRIYEKADDSVLTLLGKTKVLPLNSDPLSIDGDGDGISDSDEYEIALNNLINEAESAINNISNMVLRSNSIIDMYGFKTNITGVMKEKGKINSVYSLANERNITVNKNNNYGYLGSYNDVFFLEAFCERDSTGKINNELRIHCNIEFCDKELKIVNSEDKNGNKIYSNDSVTEDEIIKELEERWKLSANGDLYDFYRMKINITTEIHKCSKYYKPQQYAKFYLEDEEGNGHTNPLTFGSIKKVYIYNQRDFGFQTQEMILDTCAHEFGHVLGLADIYSCESNFFVKPVPYSTITEIAFEPTKKAEDEGYENVIMNIRGNVSLNEIEMIVYAAKEQKTQFFVPSGKTMKSEGNYTYSQSKAIRDKYFYQSSSKNNHFGKAFLVYNPQTNKYQKVDTLGVDDLLLFVSIDKAAFSNLYLKCYSNASNEAISCSYNEYVLKQKKYAQALYNQIH